MSNIKELLVKSAIEKYGSVINKRIIERIEEEIAFFESIDYLDALEELVNKRPPLITPMSEGGNSLVLYLLKLNIVNPLPLHHYCPRCHLFDWGGRKDNKCIHCEEEIIEDGYNLPFALFKDYMKRNNNRISFIVPYEIKGESSKYSIIINNSYFMAVLLGIFEEKASFVTDNLSEIIKCFNRVYYETNYKKHNIVSHNAFTSFTFLNFDYLDKINIESFNDLVSSISILLSWDAYDEYLSLFGDNLSLSSLDDVFILFRNYQFDDSDSMFMTNRIREGRRGYISPLCESKYKEVGMDDKYISFLKSVGPLTSKASTISNLLISLHLAKAYLEEPKRFFECYKKAFKELFDELEYKNDPIKGLAEYKSTDHEAIYLMMIDLMERK